MKLKSNLLRILIAAAAISIVVFPAAAAAQIQPTRVGLNINLLPGYYNRDITPGEELDMFLEVRNMGDTVVNAIIFTAEMPDDWQITFSPRSLESLDSGASRTVDVTVSSPRGAGRGDYPITIFAQADETTAITSTVLRINNGPSYWLWVGLGVGVGATGTTWVG